MTYTARASHASHELRTLGRALSLPVSMRLSELRTLRTGSREIYIKKNKTLLSVRSVRSAKLCLNHWFNKEKHLQSFARHTCEACEATKGRAK
jgi:hypothetical protein